MRPCHLFLSVPLFLMSAMTFAQSNGGDGLQHYLSQTLASLDQLQQNLKNVTEKQVYLGTAQQSSIALQEQLDETKSQLMAISQKINQQASVQPVRNMQWLDVNDNSNTNKKNYVNASDDAHPIYICRADFIGANPGSHAIYPGTLVAQGCRISYAGYSFISPKYSVLSGNHLKLRWVPITEVEAAMPKNQTLKNNANYPVPQYDYPAIQAQAPFDFNVKINHAMAVSGGYQGGNPVLICKTTQNNIVYIGKVVFFMGQSQSNGQQKMMQACDIGVDNKEVVINDSYTILFHTL